MARRHLVIRTPRVRAYKTVYKNGTVKIRLKWDSKFQPRKELDFQNAQMFVDSECLRYMNPLTPRRTGYMIRSATMGTDVGSGEIEYLAPYARRQYYEHKSKARWFETMKAGHKDAIMRGANKIAGGGSN